MLNVALHNSRQHRQLQHSQGSLVLARMGNDQSVWMPVDHPKVQSAKALLEIARAADGITLAMTGCEAECFCGRPCGLTGSCQLPVPASFAIGDTRFEISDSDLNLALPARPLERLLQDKLKQPGDDALVAGPAPATISRWFAAIGSLNRWSSSLQELYNQAASCAVESIGLDGAILLRRRDRRWEIAASHLPHPELGIHCDLHILDELLTSPETLFHGSASPIQWADDPNSPAVVVSPLRNAAGDLVGAIYGYRSIRTGNARRGIRYLEAHMIELLAGAVSEGIAWLQHESEVDRRRALLERAFAGTLNNGPRKIISEKREATILFADLRQSTSLAEDVEIDQLCELMSQVLDCLSAAVMDHDGLVIDYYGDGLAAMWNAPADQADHAELACRAALRMMETLPDVAADWADVLHKDLRLAIGVHTGMVYVGNAGSVRRTKYGPRGPNVHIASRTENAAKELNVPLVVTQPVAERLSNQFVTHRVCRAQIRGIQRPIELFGVSSAAIEPTRAVLWNSYDMALSLFERGQLSEAGGVLRTIDPKLIELAPVQFLAEHVQKELDRQRHRRSTDKTGNRQNGVITLGTK
jgi:adenylate cyclase